MVEPQDVGGPRRKRGRPRKPVMIEPKRRRGGQPGNTNAVKSNAHGRTTQTLRAVNRQLRAIRRRAEALNAARDP